MNVLRYLILGGAIGAVAAVVLVFGFFRSGTIESPELAVNTASQNAASEGVQVHGHWSIEVLEADGTLVEHHEFDNALIDGKFALPTVLGRTNTVGNWRVLLYDDITGSGPTASTVCPVVSSTGGSLLPIISCLTEPSDSVSAPEVSNTLTVAVTNSAGGGLVTFPDDQVELNGTAIAANDALISAVETQLKLCASSETTDNCAANDAATTSYRMTFASLSPTVAVQAGQQIVVSVVLSFS